MRVEIEDYKTGWMSIGICLKKEDIVSLIRALEKLKDSEVGQHFHISNLRQEGGQGIFSVEFSKDEETQENTFQGPSGFAMGSEEQSRT